MWYIIPPLRRQKPEDCEFEASLGYTMKALLKLPLLPPQR